MGFPTVGAFQGNLIATFNFGIADIALVFTCTKAAGDFTFACFCPMVE